ncbi:hypothetical protein J3459_018038 [Metarhizium acridum]|nr:hypothetical protein J3459_018038 [Metarhizium acridum]
MFIQLTQAVEHSDLPDLKHLGPSVIRNQRQKIHTVLEESFHLRSSKMMPANCRVPQIRELKPILSTFKMAVATDKSWILTTSPTYRPTGALRLGQVLTDPRQPASSLFATESSYVQIPDNYILEDGELRGVSLEWTPSPSLHPGSGRKYTAPQYLLICTLKVAKKAGDNGQSKRSSTGTSSAS